MKKLKKKSIIALMVFLLINAFPGCQKEKVDFDSLDKDYYSELASLVKSNLKSIGQNLREHNATFNSRDFVINSAHQNFSEGNEVYDAFLIGYENSYNNLSLKRYLKSDCINKVIEEIEVAIINSDNSSDFTDYLQAKFEEVYASNIKTEDKDFLLHYIILNKTSVEFISNNLDLISSNSKNLKTEDDEDDEGWWNSWGRCAAGTLGGVGLGALSGAAAGSVVPLIGTKVGLIVGGISGGLTGAAAAC